MGLDSHTYIGAFLVLEDIKEEVIDVKEENVKKCPNHGYVGWNQKFCSQCGEKTIDEVKRIENKKVRTKDTDTDDEKFLDLMCNLNDCQDDKNILVLFPNHKDSGQLENFDDDKEAGYSEILPEHIKECIDKMLKKHAEYIKWLTEVKKFKVIPKFGVHKYIA